MFCERTTISSIKPKYKQIIYEMRFIVSSAQGDSAWYLARVFSKFTRLLIFKLCLGCIIAIKSAKLRPCFGAWLRVEVGLALPE